MAPARVCARTGYIGNRLDDWKSACHHNRMLRQIAWLPVGAALLLCARPAVSQESAGAFPGVWEARFHGSVFAVLKIEDRGKIWGIIATGHIEVDKAGNLIEASAGGEEEAIRRARTVDSRLLFELPDTGDHGESLIEFSLEVTHHGEALLRFLNPPPNTRIKPLRFTRRGNSAVSSQRPAFSSRSW